MAARRKAAAPAGSRLRKERPAAEAERVTVYLDRELAGELRVHCARERRSLSDAVEEAVRRLLRK